jgi:Spy/CpxP family protein refolding chaperone
MRRVTAILSTAAFVLATAVAFAQAPNFAGKWAPDADKNPAPAAGGGGGRGGGRGGGGPMTITQDAKTLTIERDMGGTAVKTVYNLDGSESKNMQNGRNGQTEVVSMAKWDGAKLVITTKTANGDRVQTWYMDGADLVSESQGQNGPVKTYYKKG